MHARAWFMTIFLGLGLGLLLAEGCGPPVGGPCDSGGHCVCNQGDLCVFDCPTQHDCDVACNGVDRCEAGCVDRCQLGCQAGSDCVLDCQHDCNIDCDGVSTCDSSCGDRCDYRCHSASDCKVELGHDGKALCDSVGSCEVSCVGACELTCVSTGSCELRCAGGEPVDCGDGRQVCAPQAC